ncbi:MAG: hypothetical protein IKQ41_12790 [Clostridia bacterium]|nr:hypothetical protein [Clostridia bacterium]
MKKSFFFLFLACVYLLTTCCPAALASVGTFEDTRFQGEYTTENLQAILEEYDLNDGWFWVTRADVTQDYRGHENVPGWTETTKRILGSAFRPSVGWYGCRWNLDKVYAPIPNSDGWGECFGFAQFIGYLLSGDRNPHGHWPVFSSVYEAKGLKPGDIIRICYETAEGTRQHSAVVYEVLDDQVIFIQVCGANYNKLSIRHGFYGAGLNTTNLSKISKSPGLRIYRSPDNLDGVYPRGYQP